MIKLLGYFGYSCHETGIGLSHGVGTNINFIMNTITYKGYIGSVSFSEKDNIFFGKVEGINGLVNFEGESVEELKQSFHRAVDDYITYCESSGIPLRKSYTGTLNIRISPQTHYRIAYLASKGGVSINSFIKKALDKEVDSLFLNMS